MVVTDAVVIGAGVIGASVALELARGGRSVIVVDKGPAPGAGSTSSSSSIIRFSYSTLDAVLTAWEAAAMWNDWAGHLGVVDPDGMARFVRTGMLIFHTPGNNTTRIEQLWDEVGIAYELLDSAALRGEAAGCRPRRVLPAEAHRRSCVRRRRRRRADRDLRARVGLHRRPDAVGAQPRACRPAARRGVPLPPGGRRHSSRPTVACRA